MPSSGMTTVKKHQRNIEDKHRLRQHSDNRQKEVLLEDHRTDQRREQERDYVRKKRRKALAIYNNQCQECGETHPLLLDFHHIKDAPENYRGKQLIFYIAKRNEQIPSIQLLCANCHKLANIRDNRRYKGK